MFERSKALVASATAAPKLAETATVIAGIALIVAILALGITLGKAASNAH